MVMPHKLALHGFLVSLVVGAAFFAIVITVSGEGSGTFTLTSGDMSTRIVHGNEQALAGCTHAR